MSLPARRADAAPLSDRAVIAAAVAVAFGAHLSRPMPVLAVAGAVLVALARRHPLAIAIALLLVASFLGSRANAGLRAPVIGRWEGWVTLLDDPSTTPFGVGATVRLLGHHVQASASGRPAWRLESLAAGERIHVRGSVARVPTPLPGWMKGLANRIS